MKPAVISASSGTTEIVAAVPNMKIRVLAYRLICEADTAVTWKSGTTAISGAMYFAANGGISTSGPTMTPAGLTFEFETAPGEALNLTQGTATNIGGHLLYRTVAE